MNWEWLFRNLNHQEDEDASVNPAYGAQDINMKNQWSENPGHRMKTQRATQSPRPEEHFRGGRSNQRDQNYF